MADRQTCVSLNSRLESKKEEEDELGARNLQGASSRIASGGRATSCFEVQAFGLGLRIHAFGCGVEDSRFWAWGSGFMVLGLGLRIQGCGSGVKDSRFWVWG